MRMSEDEICELYREAADKDKEIIILAQLNAAGWKAICEVLEKRGYIAPGYAPKNLTRQAQAAQLAYEGIMIPKIAEQYGLTEKTVVRYLERQGIYDDVKRKVSARRIREKSPRKRIDDAEVCNPD